MWEVINMECCGKREEGESKPEGEDKCSGCGKPKGECSCGE